MVQDPVDSQNPTEELSQKSAIHKKECPPLHQMLLRATHIAPEAREGHLFNGSISPISIICTHNISVLLPAATSGRCQGKVPQVPTQYHLSNLLSMLAGLGCSPGMLEVLLEEARFWPVASKMASTTKVWCESSFPQ